MAGPNESYKQISPEAADLLERIREHYRAQNKASAASNYVRHLRSFFSWAEAGGSTLQTLPPNAVESFLASVDHPETTKHVMRTQIKTALKTAHNELGVDFAHLQYESGKPREVRILQKQREKEKRAEKRVEKAAAVLNLPFIPAPALAAQQAPQLPFPEAPPMPVEATPSDAPAFAGATPSFNGASHNGGSQPQIVVVPMPQQSAPKNNQNTQNNNARPMATIGGGTPQRGLTINNHTFSGAFVKISRVADGSDPFVPMGTESFVTTLPVSQLIPHGDVAAYLQQFVIPQLRLSPNTSQVPFVFHELNDRKQPTGRRDELVVGIPMSGNAPVGAPVATPGFAGAPAPAPARFDPTTEFLLQNLERQAEESRRRNEKLDEELKQAKDAQTQFLLTQQMTREQELRRELEDRKMMEMARASQAAAAPPPPVFVPPPPEPPRADPAIEMMKVNTETQSRLLEAVLVRAMTPPPPPPAPPPQKDVSEWLVPFMMQMNQQAQQQAQANQQLLVGMMQSMMTREDPMQKFLLSQLQEVKAAANAPKEDDVETFAEKLQKYKMVGEMLGGGGGGSAGPGILETLISNADTIGAGIAKVLGGGKGAKAPVETPVTPAPAPAPPQLASGPQIDASQIVAHLTEAARLAEEGGQEREVVGEVVKMINGYAAMPEPYANIGRRIVTAMTQVEDEDDLFALAKHFWVAVGQKPDKPAAKAIAKALYLWFPPLTQNMFGEARFLDGQSPETYVQPSGPAPDMTVETAPEPEQEEEGEEEEADEEIEIEVQPDRSDAVIGA